MRILLKYMVSRGGNVSADEVEMKLGSKIIEITSRLLPVLCLAYKRFKKLVKKPF